MASNATLLKSATLITAQKPPSISPNENSPSSSSILNFKIPSPPPMRAVSTTGVAGVKQGGDLADRWREIMGVNNWEGLLDPLDPLLRLELLKYGEFSVCTHEAFLGDTYARDYGICKFQTYDFFDHILMPQHGYDATKFIYCTSHNTWWPPFIPKPINPRTWQQTNVWIGFIADSNDETSKRLGRRDICVAWRGTTTGVEWGNNFRAFLSPLPADPEFMPKPDPNIKVENGFLSLYTQKDDSYSSARGLVLSEVQRLVKEVYPDEELSITVTGHSLGGALALLSAYDIVETGMNARASGAVPVCAITYAAPRLGNTKFKDRLDELGLRVLRIVNVKDKVPTVPGLVMNEKVPEFVLKGLDVVGYPFVFTHVGNLLELNSEDSPVFKKVSVGSAHDLEGYMHLIDGYQGKGKPFKSATGRDIALANKETDLLQEDKLIPPEWRVEPNRSMVQNKQGLWVHKSTLNYFVEQSN